MEAARLVIGVPEQAVWWESARAAAGNGEWEPESLVLWRRRCIAPQQSLRQSPFHLQGSVLGQVAVDLLQVSPGICSCGEQREAVKAFPL